MLHVAQGSSSKSPLTGAYSDLGCAPGVEKGVTHCPAARLQQAPLNRLELVELPQVDVCQDGQAARNLAPLAVPVPLQQRLHARGLHPALGAPGSCKGLPDVTTEAYSHVMHLCEGVATSRIRCRRLRSHGPRCRAICTSQMKLRKVQELATEPEPEQCSAMLSSASA